jgi:phosphopantothenoylcysteine decarboxylase/phosphopantothenate--cysteine ligase
MARVLLGVTGGIAAYKSCELTRLFVQAGHEVTPVLTAEAESFVTARTFEALARREQPRELYPHLVEADLLVIAPLSANTLAKLAHGLADNVLTQLALAFRGPVLVAPAMNLRMWEHPATQASVETLRERGVELIGPEAGELAEGETGIGRMSEPQAIFARCRELLGETDSLVGRTVLVTAGGTREPLDPVRFLGNRSSGRQGYALALVAAARGAEVTVVAANVALPDPTGATVLRVGSAAELHDVTLAAARDVDAVVMAAAVADFRPAMAESAKIKKDAGAPPPVVLAPTPDVLADLLAARRPGQVIAGFAAETGDDQADWLEHGRRKLARKAVDLLVVNPVGGGRAFEQKDNSGVVLTADGGEIEIPSGPKTSLAATVWTLVADRLG